MADGTHWRNWALRRLCGTLGHNTKYKETLLTRVQVMLAIPPIPSTQPTYVYVMQATLRLTPLMTPTHVQVVPVTPHAPRSVDRTLHRGVEVAPPKRFRVMQATEIQDANDAANTRPCDASDAASDATTPPTRVPAIPAAMHASKHPLVDCTSRSQQPSLSKLRNFHSNVT